MNRTLATFLAAVSGLSSIASGANIYMFTSGNPSIDNTIAAFLISRGHTVTIGVDWSGFNGSVNLSGFQTVYFQCNDNWSAAGTMPVSGQNKLIKFVNAGGRLVTGEWTLYYAYPGGKWELLAPILPGLWTSNYGSNMSTTFNVVTPHAVINGELPSSFEFDMNTFGGTETYAGLQPGATMYYSTSSSVGAIGLAGWRVGEGSVFSFGSTCGPNQVLDAEFGTVFANVMGAHAGGGPSTCYANCDGVGGLTGNDFQCFLNAYVASSSYANCDSVGGLTGNDFQCFLDKYVAGCS